MSFSENKNDHFGLTFTCSNGLVGAVALKLGNYQYRPNIKCFRKLLTWKEKEFWQNSQYLLKTDFYLHLNKLSSAYTLNPVPTKCCQKLKAEYPEIHEFCDQML